MPEVKYKFTGMTDEEKDQKLGELMHEGKEMMDHLAEYCVRLENVLIATHKAVKALEKALSEATGAFLPRDKIEEE